jgi:hypothetical protein
MAPRGHLVGGVVTPGPDAKNARPTAAGRAFSFSCPPRGQNVEGSGRLNDSFGIACPLQRLHVYKPLPLHVRPVRVLDNPRVVPLGLSGFIWPGRTTSSRTASRHQWSCRDPTMLLRPAAPWNPKNRAA